MKLLEYVKKNPGILSEIPDASEVLAKIVAALEAAGFDALANNAKEPDYIDKSKLKELQDLNTQLDAKHKDSLLESGIKIFAIKAKAKDEGDILTLLKSKLKLKDDGTIEEIEDHMKALKADKPYLFGEETAPVGGAAPGAEEKPKTLSEALNAHYKA